MSDTTTYAFLSTPRRDKAVAIPLFRQEKGNFSSSQALIDNGIVDVIIVVGVLLLIGLLGG